MTLGLLLTNICTYNKDISELYLREDLWDQIYKDIPHNWKMTKPSEKRVHFLVGNVVILRGKNAEIQR